MAAARAREQAGRLADRCGRAYSYLGDMLAFRPQCALVVLNRADWSERASNPLYGMPYYSTGNLFLAGEPSDLVARLEEVASSAPPPAAQVLDRVYGTGASRWRLSPAYLSSTSLRTPSTTVFPLYSRGRG